MVFSLHKWVSRIRLLFFVILFSIVLYHVIGFVSVWLEPPVRYKEPLGKAVKAFRSSDQELSGTTMTERLKFFYWYGE